ncbi:MAG: glycosyltransferase [Pseudomonadales bacterium]|nr:glycosyltransferase [Pseudomonadales bacterium]
MKSRKKNTVLWWGRSDSLYSRNGIIRHLFLELGWHIIDFAPRISELAGIEATFRNFPEVDLVWVPCFRQKDLAAAARWANKKKIALVFDPLISAYDKQVWERKKFSEQSRQASKLLDWERSLFLSANHVIADTKQHAEFYAESFGVNPEQLHVLPVSAEESLFFPRQSAPENEPLKVLFYGSFIGLQGPDVIATAILLYTGPEVEWYFIGDGPLRQQTEEKLSGLNNVHFSDWLPYEQLPQRISQVDLCVGIFGSTQKTQRVIPNKVYQALACARPVITCTSNAYPESTRDMPDSGLFFVPANDPEALAQRVSEFAKNPELVKNAGQYALASYQKYFSNNVLKGKLSSLLESIETCGG